MTERFELYIISPFDTILTALEKINENKKGFLLVLQSGKLVGTLTDGDIRRAFIAGKVVDDFVNDIYNRNYKSLNIKDDIGTVIDLFKNESIKFLPIIDSEGMLKNIVTKRQMHVLLLQDIRADLTFDFSSLDENIVDYEIFQRPWGFYKTTAMNDYCQSKIICVYPNEKISLQSHRHREEYWIVAHGNGLVQINDEIMDAKCGSLFHIPKGCKHRLENIDMVENLVLTEVQIGDYFGEDDIIRYDDVYGRK